MRAFTSFKIHCEEFLFNISNTKSQVLKVKLGIRSHAKSLAVTWVWLQVSGRHWQETSESPAMAPCVTSSWNRIIVTRPDTFWQHVGKLLCSLPKVSPVIQQCRFYWRDKTLLCSLKDKGVKYVCGLEQPGNPWCTNHSFLLGLPLVDAITFSLCCLRIQRLVSCHFSFSFLPVGCSCLSQVCP